MSKQMQMTVSVSPELRAEFMEAAGPQAVDDVLQQLMREYVQQSRERTRPVPNAEISVEEMERRERAVNFARASVSLEGFDLSEAVEAASRDYIAGRLTFAEYLKKTTGIDKSAID